MTRHSKQHKEVVHRAELNAYNQFYDNNWGTQKVREGADAKGDFDACVICVHQAQEPVMSPKGHIYCKECIYEFILKQKQHKKEQMAAYKKYLADQEAQEEADKVEAEEAKLEQFRKQEVSVAAKVGDKRKAEPLGYTSFKTSKGEVFLVDKEIVKEHAVGTLGLSEEQKKVRAEILPCFWVPNLTPGHSSTKVSPPNPDCSDPFGNKITIKKLHPVKFTLTPEGQKNPNLRKGRFMCPMSKKTLGNGMKLYFISKTGHVVTGVGVVLYRRRFMCPMSKKTLGNGMKLYFISKTGHVVTGESKKLIQEEGVYDGQKIKKKHIIEFANNGSGFAAAGAKTVEATAGPRSCANFVSPPVCAKLAASKPFAHTQEPGALCELKLLGDTRVHLPPSGAPEQAWQCGTLFDAAGHANSAQRKFRGKMKFN
eukprot:CAMPEP_0175170918 /NCGR_PEP_ID=MMETSP0087-20121206/30504_1 /TAXON_ID=136419 /ORGANISM="Unknown Unknown, Strain D1" /LENGTH=424 /DNA_ID=CAMNT_0016461651 /DNA_START=15 /DNA_END=1290 /DNA_ORIENTATION=+